MTTTPSTAVEATATPTASTIMDACFLQSTPCLYSHVHALITRQAEYLEALGTLSEKGLLESTSHAIKARIVAALHLTQHHDTLQNTVLPHCEVVEIVKALSLLDRPRRVRQLQQKLQAIETLHPHVTEEYERKLARREQQLHYRQRRQSYDTDDEDSQQEALQGPLKRSGRRCMGWLRVKAQLRQVEASHSDQSHNAVLPCHAAHTDSAVCELIESSSVSGSLARKIRTWAKNSVSADFLEFVILTMPTEHWKNLADLVHFHPNDFALPFFLSFVHTGVAALPEGSFVKDMKEFLEASWVGDNRYFAFQEMAQKHPQVYLSYAFLRTQTNVMSGQIKILQDLARNIPLETAVWYLEELDSNSKNLVVPDIVADRLERENLLLDNSKVTTLGKLVERILTFQSRKWHRLAQALMPIAETRLQALKVEWASSSTKVDVGATVVFGDASSSMTTAIQAATILASMISVCWNGELSFFTGSLLASPHERPSTVAQVLEVCAKVEANGCTSLAAALWPHYQAKRRLARIVMVTDEEENTECHGYMFARLLQTYRKDVHAGVELILVGVGPGCARFRQSLAECGITYKRIEIDKGRPDLSKFDALLGQLALAASYGETRQAEVLLGQLTLASSDDFVVL